MWASEKKISRLFDECEKVVSEWQKYSDDDEIANKKMSERFKIANGKFTDAIIGNQKVIKFVRLSVLLMAAFMAGWVLS